MIFSGSGILLPSMVKRYEGNDFDIPAVHLDYIRSWHKALAEENRENSRQLPHNEAELQAYLKEKGTELGKLVVK